MSDTNKSKAWLARMVEQFKASGETNTAFVAEVKRLTRKDAEDFAAWLNASGLPTEAPAPNIAFAS